MPTRFHWSPYPEESLGNRVSFTELCREADALGFETVCCPAGRAFTDAFEIARSAAESSRVKFRFQFDDESMAQPGLTYQVLNARNTLGNRFIIQIHLEISSETFALASRFLDNLRAEAGQSGMPEIHIEGDTAGAAFFAIKQADWLWRSPGAPHQAYADALPVLHFGKDVGIIGHCEEVFGKLEAFDKIGLSHFTLRGVPGKGELTGFAALREIRTAP